LSKQLAPVLALVVCVVLVACVPPPDQELLTSAIGGTGGTTEIPGSGGTVPSSTGGADGLGTGGSASGGAVGADAGVGPDGAPAVDGARAGTGGARGGAGGAGGRASGTGGMGPGTGGAPVIAAVCTSRTTYSGGTGPTMRPGASCRGCHNFTVAGTIYPTAHEPTNCNGVNGSTGVRVVITGANGQTLTLTPSSAGNFYSSTQFGGSFNARVTNNAGGTRAMLTMQTSGDCNSCHSQNGANGAPGRIMAP
jgi:hypothetical protein